MHSQNLTVPIVILSGEEWTHFELYHLNQRYADNHPFIQGIIMSGKPTMAI